MTDSFLIIYNLFFSILLATFYFGKKRIETTEIKIYDLMVFTSLMVSISSIICHFTNYYKSLIPVINNMIFKFSLCCYVTWIIIFTVYIFSVTRKKRYNFKKNTKLFVLAIYIIINYLLIYLLPLDFKGKMLYLNEKNINFIYIFSALYIIIWIIQMLINIKRIKNKKIIPAIVFILLVPATLFFEQIITSQILIISIQTFITFLMYFTIENPDVKLLNDLSLAKKQVARANVVKTEFLSSMSHEIRTPLNAIVSLGQVLLTEDIGENAKEEVKDILSSSENLLEIVNSVLDISKIESNKLEIVNSEYNFHDIFYELVSLVKKRIDNKDVEIKSNISSNVPTTLYGDGARIKQVILNLLTNSAKYTKKGVIEFNVDCLIEKDICKLIISVKDTGIGIKSKDRNKLFQKFERFDIKKNMTIEGLGLGLAITKKLVDLMKGKIKAESIYGEGSCFTVEIKQEIILDSQLVASHEDNNLINTKNKNILLVDDNVINLKVATKLLNTYGFNITSVLSGKECMELVEQGKKYDIIFLDDMMPEISGTETLKKLRLIENFDMPVVAFTANAISGMREKYLNDGFDEYLSKPLIKDDLETVIKKILK